MTPHVIKNIAMAMAVCEADHTVLSVMEHEFEQVGDYSAASEALELMTMGELSADDLKDEAIVREKLKDLLKLGELKWRYRVVDEGQNPRDEAIRVLTQCHQLLDAHLEHCLAELACGADAPAARCAVRTSEWRKEWAAELAETKQGLGVTRLIFNTDRSEDALIEKLLAEALELRQLAGLRMQAAETLNGLGSLKQKQHAYLEAERLFAKSLELRRSLPEGDDRGQAKAQAIAQSLVSLGNLHIEMGDHAPRGSAHANEQYAKGVARLEEAKGEYIKGFHVGHPKTAWALEGIAKALEKMGELRRAHEAWEEAIAIRRNLQARDTKKQMFSKELEEDEKRNQGIEERRAKSRRRFQKLGDLNALSAAADGDGGGGGGSGQQSKRLLAAARLASQCERGGSEPSDATAVPAASSVGATRPIEVPLLGERGENSHESGAR